MADLRATRVCLELLRALSSLRRPGTTVRERHTTPLKWLIPVAAVLVVIGLVVSLTGVWRAFQPPQTLTPLTELQLEPPEEVPAGGDFGAQTPSWEDCGNDKVCADVRAPLDWGDAEAGTIRLRLVKQAATGGDPIGTLFVNPGGPGASGADYVRTNIDGAVGAALQRDYDIVGWDPRGVGASSAVSCFDDAGMDAFLFGIDEDFAELERGSAEWIAAAAEESATFGAACQQNTGPLLGHVDTDSTVRDLDMLREIVGDDELHYLGYSYGTFIGARYAETYPERVGRMVLDGVLSPAATLAEVVREQTRGFESALRGYASWCLSGDECPLAGDGSGSSGEGASEAAVNAAMAEIRTLLDKVDETPMLASDGRLLGSSTLLTAIITPLYSQSNWAYLNTLFASVAEGDADLAFALADSYYGRVDGSYEDNSTVAFSAINCLDYPRDADPERMKREAAELEQLAPTIGKFQGYGDLSCAGWPYRGVNSRDAVTAAGSGPILVLGTTGDPATPYQWAVDLAEQLENGVLVTLEGEGHTAYGKNVCVDRAVESYLLDGTPPKDGLLCK